MDRKNFNISALEIAKQIGEPLNPTLPVPVELSAMCNLDTVAPGEKLWRYTAVDSTSDIVGQIESDGSITAVKRTPTGDAELTFQGLDTKKEYVLIDDILSESDNTGVLARRKAAITRGMDKKEIYTVLQAILGNTALGQANSNFVPGVSCQSVTVSSSKDLYDVISDMKHKVEDYGDDLLLLTGSTVKEEIDDYSKDNADSHNYDVNLREKLREWGITDMKVYGTFKDKSGSSYQVMDKKKMVMVARNSRIEEGKPITFVRRRIDPAIAQYISANPDEAQRLIISSQGPDNIGGTDTFGYAVWGYESVIFCITNPYAIVTADVSTII
jgi:hypothetical protein